MKAFRFRPRITPSALQRGFSFSPPPAFFRSRAFSGFRFFPCFQGTGRFGWGWLPVFCSPRAVPRMRFRAKRVEGCRSASSGPGGGGGAGCVRPRRPYCAAAGKSNAPGLQGPGHRNSGRAGRQRASRRKTALS